LQTLLHFHFAQDCFVRWRASRRQNDVKCPNCNKVTRNFVKLFLSAAQDDEQEQDEDDISISSDEDDGNDDNDNDDDDNEENRQPRDKEKEDDGNETPVIAAAVADDDENENEGPTINNNNNTNNANVEIVNVDDEEEENMIDLTSEESEPTRNPAIQTQTSTQQSSSDYGRKLLKKTKGLKRRAMMLESRNTEQQEKKTRLLEQHSEITDRLELLTTEKNTLEQKSQINHDELETIRLEVVGLRSGNGTLAHVLGKEHNRATAAEKRAVTQKFRYKQEVAKANDSSSLAEVRDMLAEYPKLCEENKRLKEQKELLLQRLKEEDHRPDTNVRGGGESSSSQQQTTSKRRRTSHLQMAKSLLDMERVAHSWDRDPMILGDESQRQKTTKATNTSAAAAAKAPTIKMWNGKQKHSVPAVRMAMTAALHKVTARKYSASDERLGASSSSSKTIPPNNNRARLETTSSGQIKKRPSVVVGAAAAVAGFGLPVRLGLGLTKQNGKARLKVAPQPPIKTSLNFGSKQRRIAPTSKR
jgi:hypothetical protein